MQIRDVKPEHDNIYPKCPHCEKELSEVLRVKMGGFWRGSGFCFVCPKCEKIIGFADYATG